MSDDVCPALHIVHEIGVWLAGPDATQAVQRAAASEALHNGKRAHAALLSSRADPHDVVITELTIDNGDGPKSVHFRQVPSPIDLLLLIAPNAHTGASVQMRQVTAGCGTVTVEERWPFGMDEATEMTVPAIARLHPEPCLGTDTNLVPCAEADAIDDAGSLGHDHAEGCPEVSEERRTRRRPRNG